MRKVYALFFSLMMILATVTVSMNFTAGAAEARGRRHRPPVYHRHGHPGGYHNPGGYYGRRRHHDGYNRNRHRHHRRNRTVNKVWRYIHLYNQVVRGYGPYTNYENRPPYHHNPNCHGGYCEQQCGWQYLPQMGGWYFLCY